MKKFIHMISYVLCTFVLLTTTAYAWYTSYFGVSADEEKLSSNASYYASGTGTSKDPFVITEARHLYNLAWLQDLGYYDADKDSDTTTSAIDKFYFELGANINMKDLTKNGVQSPIPPIGIDQHPFISNFEGNGYTIDNLRIDTKFDNTSYIKPDDIVLDQHRTDTIDNSNVIRTNYVGLFGYVGPSTITSAVTEKVQNFYIDNAVITSTKNCLAGIIAGYVSTNINDVGVHYGRISMNGTGITGLSNNIISYYSLIGDYDKTISWEDKPSADSSGSGSGDSLAYGGNFDTDLFFQRMALIYANKQSSTPSPYLPEMESEYLPASGYKVPLTVVRSTITEANYTGATAKETISSENIGYALGNQNKEREITMEFGDPLIKPSDNNSSYVDSNGETPSESKKVPRQMFKIIGQNGNYQGGQIQALTDAEFAALPENIKNLIPDSNVKNKRTFLRLQQRYAGNINVVYGSQNDAWSPMGQISYYGKTYGEDGTLYNTGIVLPQNAIWFKPKKAGTVRIVMYSADNGKSFRITKVRRNSATTENPFAGSDLEDVTSSDSTIQSINNYGKNIPAYIIAYYEFEISQEEINAGNIEYMITKGDENGAYFYYLDIGISGSEGGDAPTQDPVIVYGAIDDIDFVYRTGDAGTGDYISLGEELSNVFFQISGTTTGAADFFFRRNNDNNDNYAGIEGIVLYFPSEGNSLTLNWSKAGTKGKAKDDDCEELDGSVSTGGLNGSEAGSSTTLKTVTFAYKDVNNTLQVAGISNITSGYAITEPDLSIPGYEINGYYSDEACTTEYVFGKTAITENTTIYVNVTALITYDVTFDPNNGSSTTTTKVAAGGLLTKPTDPIKSGYIFDCWVKSDGTEFDFSTPITEDTTIYAKFISTVSSSYEHNFTENGTNSEFYTISGSLSTSKGSVTYNGESLTQCLKIESKTNITFTIESDSTLTLVFNSDGSIKIDGNAQTIGSDGILTIDLSEGTHTISRDGEELYLFYMKVETAAAKYTVSFESNGGTAVDEQNITIGSTASKPDAPTRNGYFFAGWYSDASLSTPYDFSSIVLETKTLYAKWIEEYTITFNVDGEETTATTDINGKTTFPTDPQKEGYIFTGWFVGDAEVSSNTVFSQNTTVEARFVEIFTITIDYNDDAFDSVTLETDVNGKVTEFPVVSKDGYEITSWYIIVDDSQVEVTTDYVFTADSTVYAVWEEAVGINVIFDADGGSFEDGSTSVVVSTKSDGTVVLPTVVPTKDGYVFVGWSTEQGVPDWKSDYVVVDETTIVSSETTVYAVWKAGKIITFKYANNGIADLDGTDIGSITVRQGVETSQTITPPTVEGYEFVGWYWNQTINSWDNQVSTYTPWNDTTLYAKYEPVSTSSLMSLDEEVNTITISVELNNIQELDLNVINQED